MTAKNIRRNPHLRLHRATGRGRVILSGQHFYTRAPFDSLEAHEEYVQLIRRWKDNGRRPLREVVAAADVLNPTTVRDLVVGYEEHLDRTGTYRKDGAPTSQRALISIALRELVEAFGKMPLRSFAKAELIQHRDQLRYRERLTDQGVNRKIGLIKGAFRWGSERGFVPDHNLVSIESLRPLRAQPRTRRQPVPDEHIQAVLPKLAPTLQAMVRLQRLTGMRPGEVCAMRWMDINQEPEGDAGELGLWRYVVVSSKTNHHGGETSYLLNTTCQEILERFVKTPGAFIFGPKDTVRQRWPGGAHGLLQDAGARYTTRGYRQAVERACVAAGAPVFTPHQIRHAFITSVANDPSLGLPAASEAANHRSQQSTLAYVHPDRRLAIRVAEAMCERNLGGA